MNKTLVITAAILILLAIALGAFGAHALKEALNEEGLRIFETGVRYQMYMGLGLLAVGLSADKFTFKLKWFYRLGFIGVLLFSGLLYILAFKEHAPTLKILGAIVPLGGSLMIISWLTLIFNLMKRKVAK